MYYFIPLAYDRIDPEKGTGKGTIERCGVLKEVAWEMCEYNITSQDKCVFVTSAGYTKESPTSPTPTEPISLAKQIEDCLVKKRDWHVIAKPLAFGTYEEIKSALGLICDEQTRRLLLAVKIGSSSVSFPTIYISTNPGHMPRVRLCCYFLKRKMQRTHIGKSKFVFVPANHKFTTTGEQVGEVKKFLGSLYYFLSKKW